MRLCGFLLLFLLFFFLTALTCVGSTWNRSHGRQRRAHHRPLTDEQKTDKNLLFMLSLYRSAAGPDGRPKQNRKFGSNTVRLLRPTASWARYLPAMRDHHVSFTVHYDLDTLPSEQLVRASFVHLRSGSAPGAPPRAPHGGAPRCKARLSALGHQSLAVLEPHERWTETDITAHVLRDAAPRLTLTAHYWCSEAGHGARPWWSRRGQRHGDRALEPQVEVPSLLLYLQEERQVNDWMGELLGRHGHDFVNQIRHGPPAAVRQRRSRDETAVPTAAAPADSLKGASPLPPPSSPPSSLLSDLPNYKRKTGTPKNRCKLHSFRLSFDQLGWGHYFIAPPMYNPRFCRGDCPRLLPYGYDSPNHAVIQNSIHELGLGDVPLPSCVPYKYLPLSVLVVHKKKVEYRELEDMVADSCTCR